MSSSECWEHVFSFMKAFGNKPGSLYQDFLVGLKYYPYQVRRLCTNKDTTFGMVQYR